MIIDLGPEDGMVMGRAGSIGVTPQESKRGATVVRSSEKATVTDLNIKK
jgi:hypothetical protein